jgi:glyoxylase-like metal-dependent hydrolase (beta-lactamase superfamily II)
MDGTPTQPGPRRQEAEPASEEITEVAPGILRLQLPVPLPGLKHVNCYAMEDERGWTVVDPGLPGPMAFRALRRRIHQAGFRMRDVHSVVVTHSHPDHFGGAGRLREAAGADVVTASNFSVWWDPDDRDDVALADADVQPHDPDHDPEHPTGGTGTGGADHAHAHPHGAEAEADGDGADPDDESAVGGETPWGGKRPRPPLALRAAIAVSKPFRRRLFPAPKPSVRLDDAETVRLGRREWVAVHTPGHTPDHLCLYDPEHQVLLSGDHVLPTITPHISGLDAGPDPLASFVESLDKVSALPGVRHVLPAHGHPFSDLPGRVDDIRRHHDERLDRLRDHLEEMGEGTVGELSRRLFRPKAWGPMAESETYAHLEHMRLAGQAARHPRRGTVVYTLR